MTTANIFSVGNQVSKVYDALGAGSNGDVKRAEEAAEVFGAVMNQMAQDASSMQSEENVVVENESISTDLDSAKASYEYSAREHRIEEASEKEVDLPEESVVKEVEELTEEAVEMICEKLNISKTELFATMENLGISEAELFQPGKLGQLVMEITGEFNVFNLLTNSDFQSMLQELGAIEKEIAISLGMDLKQFQEVVQDVLMQGNVDALQGDAEVEKVEVQQVVPETELEQIPEKQETENTVPQNEVSANEVTQTTDSQLKDESVMVQTEVENVDYTEEQELSKGTTQEQTEKVNLELTNQKNAEMIEDVQVENLEVNTEDVEVNLEVKVPEEKQNTTQSEDSFEKVMSQKIEQPQKNEHRDNSSFENRNQQFQDGITNGGFSVEISSNEIIGESFSEISYSNIDVDDLIQQFVENTRVAVLENKTTVDMQLNPENLGKIYLHLTAEEGAVQAQIMATNDTVKEALETQMATLRENLNQAGVKVESIEISVATHEFEQNLEQNNRQEEQKGEMQEELSKGRRNINLTSLDELAGVLSEEEVLVAQMMRDNGNSVDFTA